VIVVVRVLLLVVGLGCWTRRSEDTLVARIRGGQGRMVARDIVLTAPRRPDPTLVGDSERLRSARGDWFGDPQKISQGPLSTAFGGFAEEKMAANGHSTAAGATAGITRTITA